MIRSPLRVVFAAVTDKDSIVQVGDRAEQVFDLALLDVLLAESRRDQKSE